MRWAEARLTDRQGQKPTFQLDGYEPAIPCLASGEERGTIIDIGGIPTAVDLTIIVRLEHFVRADSSEHTADQEHTADVDLPVPVSGKVIIYRGNRYRVITCT